MKKYLVIDWKNSTLILDKGYNYNLLFETCILVDEFIDKNEYFEIKGLEFQEEYVEALFVSFNKDKILKKVSIYEKVEIKEINLFFFKLYFVHLNGWKLLKEKNKINYKLKGYKLIDKSCSALSPHCSCPNLNNGGNQ